MTTILKLGARLRAARKAAGFKTSKEFLKKHKVPASTYSQHESGARTPDDEALKFYSKIFGISFNWLKTGEGQPYVRTNIEKKNTIAEELIDLKQWKASASPIDHELLENILSELLRIHESKLSANNTKKISKEASQIYSDIISSEQAKEIQKKMLKPAIAAYQRSVNRKK